MITMLYIKVILRNDLPNGIGLAIWPQDVRNFRRVYFGEWKDGYQNGIGFWSEIDKNSTKNEWDYVDGDLYRLLERL